MFPPHEVLTESASEIGAPNTLSVKQPAKSRRMRAVLGVLAVVDVLAVVGVLAGVGVLATLVMVEGKR